MIMVKCHNLLMILTYGQPLQPTCQTWREESYLARHVGGALQGIIAVLYLEVLAITANHHCLLMLQQMVQLSKLGLLH